MLKELTENALQSECFQHHWNSYPSERGLLFHVNNKARNAIEGNKFKAMGVVPGVSDMIYLAPGGRPYLLEFKLPGEKQSPKQKDWQQRATQHRYQYLIITSFEQFLTLLKAIHDEQQN